MPCLTAVYAGASTNATRPAADETLMIRPQPVTCIMCDRYNEYINVINVCNGVRSEPLYRCVNKCVIKSISNASMDRRKMLRLVTNQEIVIQCEAFRSKCRTEISFVTYYKHKYGAHDIAYFF